MFSGDGEGLGGFFNRRFSTNFIPNFNDRGNRPEGGYDGYFARRSFTPYFFSRGRPGRGGYDPSNDQPDPKDIEFVQS